MVLFKIISEAECLGLFTLDAFKDITVNSIEALLVLIFVAPKTGNCKVLPYIKAKSVLLDILLAHVFPC